LRLLLDTHLLVWASTGSEKLPSEAHALIEDPANELLFSAISIWEVAIKFALQRPSFKIDPRILRRGLLATGYVELPVTARHAETILSLPPIHKDPADRILIAQAIAEGITLLTVDATIASYPGPIRAI
jgi:PIN domain nuclease of toxin-antitoxin system